jgi:hypothetical protein
MNPTLKNVLAVIAGILVGGAVNMGIIIVSGSIIPLPEGVDPTNMESLEAKMHLFEARHFILPFLAHALCTLAGAFLTVKIAANHKMNLALAVGIFFLIGGIINAYLLPAPAWFLVLDLALGYLPMGWLGGRLAIGKR